MKMSPASGDVTLGTQLCATGQRQRQGLLCTAWVAAEQRAHLEYLEQPLEEDCVHGHLGLPHPASPVLYACAYVLLHPLSVQHHLVQPRRSIEAPSSYHQGLQAQCLKRHSAGCTLC